MRNLQNNKPIDLEQNSDDKVLVIGAGVSGLTTAICLRESGFRVVIVADRFTPNLTSIVAGALWEWPPAVCGKHGTPRSLERSKVWCMVAYEKFKQIQSKYGSEQTGVYLRDAYFYFKDAIENRPSDLKKMNELKDKVDGFQRGLHIVRDTIDLGFQGGIKDAYKHQAPMVDTDIYMKWLFQYVKDIGCEIIQDQITVNILQHEQELIECFGVKAIVNCAGLGSIVTTGDPSMYPLRGALVRVKNLDGIISDAHCIAHDDSSNNEQDIIFIVPRGKDDIVVLGGLAQPNQWDTNLSLEIQIIRQMYDGCLQFLQELRDLPLDENEPVRTGLRPLTEKNVCVERVPDTRVFYNYGHGGSGVTLSWGCSTEIVRRVEEMLREDSSSIPFAGQDIDAQKQTIFILNNTLPMKADLSHITTASRNLVLLCSREGLSKVVPSQYEYLHLVKIVEPYNLENLLEVYQQIKAAFALQDENCRIVTNDEYSVFLAAQMRQELEIEGDLPTLIHPFTNKKALKLALKNSKIRLPKYLIFDPEQYCKTSETYLATAIDKLGFPIFVKPVIGAGSEKTQRIYNLDELRAWCEDRVDAIEEFELNEFITGQLYNTSIVIKDGEPCYFAACKYYRPNDEFIYGYPIGNIVVREEDPEFNKLQQFSLDTIKSLEGGYPKSGVLNIDFFLQEGTEEPVLMEIASLPPEGLVSKMFYSYQGVRLQEIHLQLQMGDTPKIDLKPQQEWKYSAYSIYPKQSGVVTEIEKPFFKSEMEVSWHIYLGQELQAAKSMRDVAIAMLLCNDDFSVLQADYEAAHSKSFYEVEGGSIASTPVTAVAKAFV